MNSIPEFIKRKHDLKLIKYLDPRLKPILEKSYGLITYQDDVLTIAVTIAGYSWTEADKLRKAIGKKIPHEMKKQKEKFIKGCVLNELDLTRAKILWDLIEPFAGYGFNKAHAAAYAYVAYQTAYVKTNFPIEYMTALLSAESAGNSGPQRDEKISRAVNECKRMNIPVLPPDINQSEIDFTISKFNGAEAIRFGLSAIKNVGVAAIGTILETRRESVFKSLPDFINRVDLAKVNRKTVESLIKAGAMDVFGRKTALLSIMDNLIQKAHKVSSHTANGQTMLFSPVDDANFLIPDIEEFSQEELLRLEKEFLGFYLSEHPNQHLLAILNSKMENRITDILELTETDLKSSVRVRIGGIISGIRLTVTKSQGYKMAFIKLEDNTGSLEVVVFPRLFERVETVLVRDAVIIVEGKVDYRQEQTTLIAEELYSFRA